ncbi:transcription initiation factor IIA subunit 2-like [Aotus nancymaae]|uniref:transcription initiation factor IIA subunit 2-like n=1 Tax=Aotus nancymaae TaxID=37293 RepID=UPI0030FE73B7
MSYQLYRNTALGNSLQESLDELMQSQQFTQLALQVLLQFEKAINSSLTQRIRIRVYFRGSLNTYRFCLMPCMVVHARHSSTLGGKGGRIT